MSIHQLHRALLEAFLLSDHSDHTTTAPFGLTPTLLSLLRLLDTTEGRRLVDLAAALLLDASTTTRVIDRLERDGIVRRAADPSDRRAQRVTLTEAGLELRARSLAAHQESLAERFAPLSAAEQDQLTSLLDKLCAGLRARLDLTR